MSYDYSENILVQGAAGDLLRDELGWDVVFAYNEEKLGTKGTLGRTSYKEILLVRYFRNALKDLNPWITDTQIMVRIYDKLRNADIVVIASPVYFYGISTQLKAVVDRLHTPMRNTFRIKKLGLLLVGAAELPNLFEPIIMQYQMVLDFFKLESIGMVLVRGVKDIGDIEGSPALKEAYELGNSI